MLIQPYRPDELRFAYCYRIYMRWRTHRARPCAPLAKLDKEVLAQIATKYDMHVLESTSDETNLLVLASLKPEETVSACASKLKGQTSRWLREALGLQRPTELLSNGYFACTSGQSDSTAVAKYLGSQTEHHGYDDRPVPPVYVESFELTPDDEARLNSTHSRTILQFHLVFATTWRRGILGSEEARGVAARWRDSQYDLQFVLRKVSFVPDHVHIAVRVHPSVSPAKLVTELMNLAQEVIFDRFAESVVRARVDRLWQPSAYLGSFGDLATPKIRKYMENWAAEHASNEPNDPRDKPAGFPRAVRP